MKKNEKHLSLRIGEELLRGFDYVSRYDDRSMNWLLNSLIRKCIAEFEAEHGKIELSTENQKVRNLLPGGFFVSKIAIVPCFVTSISLDFSFVTTYNIR